MREQRVKCIVDCFCDGEGSAKIGNTIWRWEFHEYMGPTFYRGKKSDTPVDPPARSPVWDAFNEWLWAYHTHKGHHDRLKNMARWYTPKANRLPQPVIETNQC